MTHFTPCTAASKKEYANQLVRALNATSVDESELCKAAIIFGFNKKKPPFTPIKSEKIDVIAQALFVLATKTNNESFARGLVDIAYAIIQIKQGFMPYMKTFITSDWKIHGGCEDERMLTYFNSVKYELSEQMDILIDAIKEAAKQVGRGEFIDEQELPAIVKEIADMASMHSAIANFHKSASQVLSAVTKLSMTLLRDDDKLTIINGYYLRLHDITPDLRCKK